MPTARAHILADGLDRVREVALAKGKRFDWVISNPPVHAGHPDDFSVLQELIAGMPSFYPVIACSLFLVSDRTHP